MKSKNPISQFLLTFFHLLYHQFAWCYDWVAWIVSAGRWKSWVQSVEKHLSGPNILEIGHGPGHLQTHLKNIYPLLVGLDESRQMGKLARKNIQKAYPGMQKNLIRAAAQFIPVKSEMFNTVIATFPAQFIFEESSLMEIYRVLKPDGMLVILLAVQFTGVNLISQALKILYTLTGETTSPKQLEYLERAVAQQGFLLQVEQEQHRNEKLLLVKARKIRIPPINKIEPSRFPNLY